MSLDGLTKYEGKFLSFLEASEQADTAHDISHIMRVVKVAKQLAFEEQADFAVVVPAAWLHDCVSLPKNHADRVKASTLAGDKAVELLASIGYPTEFFNAIHHAITAHSYSANITPETLEAKIVQDADRLDALGAIGIARCMQVSGALNRTLYSLEDPFCEYRALDDSQFAIDHFYNKLFNLTNKLNTDAAQAEGRKRERFMREFLSQLAHEV